MEERDWCCLYLLGTENWEQGGEWNWSLQILGTQGHFLWWGVNLSGSKVGISNQWWWILRQCHSGPCVVSSQPYSFWARQPAGGFSWTASFPLPWCRIAVIDLFATTNLPLAWASQSWRESEPDLSHYHSVLSPCSWINSPLLPLVPIF